MSTLQALLVSSIIFFSTISISSLSAAGGAVLPDIYAVNTTPKQDATSFQTFFKKKFPDLPWKEFANGMYSMDTAMRENWEQIEEFPPYEPTVESGETLWNTPFANGRGYADCFPEAGIVNEYPKWDRDRGMVVTVPMVINDCRTANGEEPIEYGKPDIIAVQAYMAYQSRGKPTKVVVPADDPGAFEAYNKGKEFYFARRGQLNMACYHCHFDTAGQRIRANVLSPALGQTSHWPAYRSKWGGMGSLHRRYKGCNKQIRAKPYALQSDEYRNLEYFHTHMSNGIPLNGPGARF